MNVLEPSNPGELLAFMQDPTVGTDLCSGTRDMVATALVGHQRWVIDHTSGDRPFVHGGLFFHIFYSFSIRFLFGGLAFLDILGWL